MEHCRLYFPNAFEQFVNIMAIGEDDPKFVMYWIKIGYNGKTLPWIVFQGSVCKSKNDSKMSCY